MLVHLGTQTLIPMSILTGQDPNAEAGIDGIKPLQTVLTQVHANISAAQQIQIPRHASRVLHGAKPHVAVAPTAHCILCSGVMSWCVRTTLCFPLAIRGAREVGDGRGERESSLNSTSSIPAEQKHLVTGKRRHSSIPALQVNDYVVACFHKIVRKAGAGCCVWPYCLAEVPQPTVVSSLLAM